MVVVSDSGLVTIAGGKWTTYRAMAVDTVDAAIEACRLQPTSESQTDELMLYGSAGWTPTLFIQLVQGYGLDVEVAKHLANTYGDRASEVARMSRLTGKRWPIVGRRLVTDFPYIEAEVQYAVKEFARTAVDVLARRTRLAFLNIQAAEEALPTIVRLMGDELHWSPARREAELRDAMNYLRTMGYDARYGAVRYGDARRGVGADGYRAIPQLGAHENHAYQLHCR